MQTLLATILLLLTQATTYQPQDTTIPYLDIKERMVSDTAAYDTFRLHVINPGDSLVVLEQVVPSCGCVLATIQHNLATKGHPGEIYVAVTTSRLDSLQPITIDVVTNQTRTLPLRLTIRKQTTTSH
jgi:hypothetical protein